MGTIQPTHSTRKTKITKWEMSHPGYTPEQAYNF